MRLRFEAETKLDAATSRIVSIEHESNKSQEEATKKITLLEENIRKLQKDIQQVSSKANIEV
jgi:prefoldin subunit 5